MLFFDATEENASLVEDSLATDHFERGRTCAGGEQVFDGVHTMLGEFLVVYTCIYLLLSRNDYKLIEMRGQGCKALGGIGVFGRRG